MLESPESVEEQLRAALASPAFSHVERAYRAAGRDPGESLAAVQVITEDAAGWQALAGLKQALIERGAPSGDAVIERFWLMQAALAVLSRVAPLAVPSDVRQLIFDEFAFFAEPEPQYVPLILLGAHNFVAMCKLATLRRFPAGQLHWEESGLPRSWLLKGTLSSRLRVGHFFLTRMRGRRPVFFPHLAMRRPNRFILTEAEQLRSYHRMARAMKLQPAVKGLVGESWFFSPDTYVVSPHLAWLARVFREEGGLVSVLGPADAASGVLAGGHERKRLYDEGKFHPTTAVVLWPRRAMLAWADAHPEYGG